MKGTSANNRTHGFAQVVARMIAAQAIEAARVGLDQEMMLVTFAAPFGLDVKIAKAKEAK